MSLEPKSPDPQPQEISMTTQRTLQAIQQMENLQNLYTAASIGIISPEELEAQLRKIHDTSESSQ